MVARSMWKGSISFGLVNIPVEMYRASREREFGFSLLHDKDHSQIRYARICKQEDKEIPWNHIVKGYETDDGKVVIFSNDEFKQLALERTDTLDIKQFSDALEVDPNYFEKPYYLKPQKGAQKTYALLVAALDASQKVAITTYVLHNRQHLGVLRPKGNLLILNQLRYDEEIQTIADVKLAKAKPSRQEIEMAIQLISQMTAAFEPSAFKDTYSAQLEKLIKRKEKGAKIKIAPKEPEATAKVYDIMSALKESLREKPKKTRRRRA